MRSRSIAPTWKRYRVCPECNAKYVPDARTRSRLVLLVVFALATVALAVASHVYGYPWSLATVLCGTGLFIFLGYILSRMRYVEFRD